jgi:hypothetical protein
VAKPRHGDFKDKHGRDWTVRDYRTHLQTVLKRAPATVNSALAAVDDLYLRRGLGPAKAARAELPTIAPARLRSATRSGSCALSSALARRVIGRSRLPRSTPGPGSPRPSHSTSTTSASPPQRHPARVVGKGEKIREIPIHPKLRDALGDWLEERQDWPGANTPALYLNQRGGRLSVKGAHDIITGIAESANLDEHITAYTLRHTFATRLVRGRVDLITVAELLGHARLETTRAYSRPTHKDRAEALSHLDVDQ